MFILDEDLQFVRIKIEQITRNISALQRSILNPKRSKL